MERDPNQNNNRSRSLFFRIGLLESLSPNIVFHIAYLGGGSVGKEYGDQLSQMLLYSQVKRSSRLQKYHL